MKTVLAKDLVFDFTIYPRVDVDSTNVSRIEEALRVKTSMPPVVIEEKSNRIVDGFHRVKAYLAVFGPKYGVECATKRYKNDGELFMDAMKYNANHGRALSPYDRVRCVTIAQGLHIEVNHIASSLSVTVDKIGDLLKTRTAHGAGGHVVPLKNTIKHMAQQDLTPEQETANKKLSGLNQLFYINQVLLLIESGLLNLADANIAEGIERLREAIKGLSQKVA